MTVEQLNQLPTDEAKAELLKCCGAERWANAMLEIRPFTDMEHVLFVADHAWEYCQEVDQLEAFSHHPKIGDVKSLEKKFASTKEWAGNEQKGVNEATSEVINDLADLNSAYEEKFGFIFIICATGQSAGDMLEALKERIDNDREKELRLAAAEQHKITKIRLNKLLQ